MQTLTIISHTEHYKQPDGTIVGLGSTVTEINQLLDIFDSIIHVAMLHDTSAPPSSLPYVSDRITFVAIPALGGPNVSDKLSILWKIPSVLKTVKSAISKTDYFQFRAPTGIGVFVIPYLVFLSKKKGWFKYAGNWKQKSAPLAYRFQRWILKNQSRKVTINGIWDDQPKQCLSFENPCLTREELELGHKVIQLKQIKDGAIDFCFVGRLEDEKGVGILINAFIALTTEDKSKIHTIHIVGDGKSMSAYKRRVKDSELNFRFHGFLARHEVHKIYELSHCIILPSANEGFPKVISEAMNYGCLPIVSDISSLSHYIKNEVNGFLIYPITSENLHVKIKKVLNLTPSEYAQMITSQINERNKFTYSYYNNRITNEILEVDI